jgi:TRAP-type C4-dicarboxylate transport system substrate-binding protein
VSDVPGFAPTPATSSRLSRRGFLGASGAALAAAGFAGTGLAAAGLSGCGSSGPSAGSGGASGGGRKMTLKFSQVQIADSPEGRSATKVADRIHELTGGSVSVHVFPNSTLAPSNDVAIQQLVTGALDMAAVGGWTSLVTAGAPFELPYAFDSFTQIRQAFAGTPGATVKAGATPLGVRLLNWWVIATWRNTYGDRAIHTPHDLKGVKIRTQGTPSLDIFYKQVGAFPQTVASNETYLALQTKQVDLMESSFQFAQQQKHYEVARYGSQDQHGVSALALMVSNKVWARMSVSQQQAVQQAFDESVAPHDDDSAKSVASVNPFLQQHGMTINTVDLAPFVSTAKSLYPKMVTQAGAQQVLRQLQDMGAAGG